MSGHVSSHTHTHTSHHIIIGNHLEAPKCSGSPLLGQELKDEFHVLRMCRFRIVSGFTYILVPPIFKVLLVLRWNK